ADHACGVQRLEVLRGVRVRLAARSCELVDRARGLGKEVEQFEPSRARECLAHDRDRLEQGVLGSCGGHQLLFKRPLDSLSSMFFRQLLNDSTACASYALGCKTHSQFAVVDPHVDLVDDYIAIAEAQGAPIVAVLDTHVQADHVSGLPELVRRTGATAYLPEGSGVEFAHHPLADGDVV